MTRRRTVAATGVALCLLADVVGVAAAANTDDGSAASPFTTMSRIAFLTGTSAQATSGDEGAGSDRSVTGASTVEAVPGAKAPSPASVAKPGAAKVVQRGNGRFTVLAPPRGSVKSTPSSGRKVTYTLEAEGGLGVDAGVYAKTVVNDLTDARGWQRRDKVRFVNLTPAQAASGRKPDLRITLASPDTTDRLCAPLQTRGQVSCHNGGRVVLNARRWLHGADAYGKDLTRYRSYLVNHEVGHGIGHGHVQCAGKGRPASVMMQQTYGLQGCTAWPWPATRTD